MSASCTPSIKCVHKESSLFLYRRVHVGLSLMCVFRRRGRRRETFTLLRLLLCYFFFLSVSLGQVMVIVHILGWATKRKKRSHTCVCVWQAKINIMPYLNLPSLSKRSDDLHVRSTENFSKFTLRIRQWMVIPIYTHTHKTYIILNSFQQLFSSINLHELFPLVH